MATRSSFSLTMHRFDSSRSRNTPRHVSFVGHLKFNNTMLTSTTEKAATIKMPMPCLDCHNDITTTPPTTTMPPKNNADAMLRIQKSWSINDKIPKIRTQPIQIQSTPYSLTSQFSKNNNDVMTFWVQSTNSLKHPTPFVKILTQFRSSQAISYWTMEFLNVSMTMMIVWALQFQKA